MAGVRIEDERSLLAAARHIRDDLGCEAVLITRGEAGMALLEGDGFRVVEPRGSEHRDELTPAGFLSNHAGGTLGGISSGQDVVVSMALKPTSSIVIPGRSIDVAGQPVEVSTTGRHDPCVGIRAVPIAEAMLALVLMDHYLRHRAQNADVRCATPVVPGSADRGRT